MIFFHNFQWLIWLTRILHMKTRYLGKALYALDWKPIDHLFHKIGKKIVIFLWFLKFVINKIYIYVKWKIWKIYMKVDVWLSVIIYKYKFMHIMVYLQTKISYHGWRKFEICICLKWPKHSIILHHGWRKFWNACKYVTM